MRFLLVLALLALSGCASPAATPTPPSASGADENAPAEVVLHSCLENAVDIPVEVSEAQKFLPEGVKAKPIGPTGLAAVELIAVRCESDVAGEDGAHAFIAWMVVDPPERLREAGVAGYLFLFAMTTDDPAVADALAALGVPAAVSKVEFSTETSPAHVVGRGGASADGWSASIETLIPARAAPRSHPIIRVLVGDGTAVTGAVDVDAGSHPHYDGGEGRLSVTGNPPFPAPAVPGIAVHGYDGHLGFRAVAPIAG